MKYRPCVLIVCWRVGTKPCPQLYTCSSVRAMQLRAEPGSQGRTEHCHPQSAQSITQLLSSPHSTQTYLNANRKGSSGKWDRFLTPRRIGCYRYYGKYLCINAKKKKKKKMQVTKRKVTLIASVQYTVLLWAGVSYLSSAKYTPCLQSISCLGCPVCLSPFILLFFYHASFVLFCF